MANTFLFARGQGGRQVALREGSRRHRALDRRRRPRRPSAASCCRSTRPSPRNSRRTRRARVVDVDHVADDEMILDIGPKSIVAVEEVLGEIKTLVWNGPFGAFETPPFDAATMAIAQDRRAPDQGGQADVGRRRRRHGRRAQRGQGRRTTSPTSRPRAARSSNGWKARRCRASRRCGRSRAARGPRSERADRRRRTARALRRAADQSPFVIERGLGQSAAVAAEQAARLEADPFALRSAEEIDGQIAIDEDDICRSPARR